MKESEDRGSREVVRNESRRGSRGSYGYIREEGVSEVGEMRGNWVRKSRGNEERKSSDSEGGEVRGFRRNEGRRTR